MKYFSLIICWYNPVVSVGLQYGLSVARAMFQYVLHMLNDLIWKFVLQKQRLNWLSAALLIFTWEVRISECVTAFRGRILRHMCTKNVLLFPEVALTWNFILHRKNLRNIRILNQIGPQRDRIKSQHFCASCFLADKSMWPESTEAMQDCCTACD
jgi:hypothetical protein